jgi:hypothetical protein
VFRGKTLWHNYAAQFKGSAAPAKLSRLADCLLTNTLSKMAFLDLDVTKPQILQRNLKAAMVNIQGEHLTWRSNVHKSLYTLFTAGALQAAGTAAELGRR